MDSQPERPDSGHHELADIGREELAELHADLAWHREQLNIAVTALRACNAVVLLANDRIDGGIGHPPGGSDAVRVAEASDALRALLQLAVDRPGSWEAEAVAKLQEPLRAVLAALEHGVVDR